MTVKHRRLGKTGYEISVIGFGAWAIGADWGTVDDKDSLAALHAAADAGVNFIDTADVYGDGRSERVINGAAARVIATREKALMSRATRNASREVSLNAP